MRIIFVGIHNKQGLQPLDSSTPSGKRIDAIIESFTGYNCIKANLFDLHYFPLGIDPKAKAEEFSNRMAISEGDIVVCLGKSVCDYLAKRLKCTVLKCPHPSPMTQIPKDAYTKDITNRLNNVLNAQECDATKSPSMGEPLANNSPKEEDVEKMAEAAIPNHPYPDMNYPGDAVTKISRNSWIAGYNAGTK
jgi:hypothetical protein